VFSNFGGVEVPKIDGVIYKPGALLWGVYSGVAIGCAKHAVHASPSLSGVQTNRVWGRRGSFWNPCTRARSNLATPLGVYLSEGKVVNPKYGEYRLCEQNGVKMLTGIDADKNSADHQ